MIELLLDNSYSIGKSWNLLFCFFLMLGPSLIQLFWYDFFMHKLSIYVTARVFYLHLKEWVPPVGFHQEAGNNLKNASK